MKTTRIVSVFDVVNQIFQSIRVSAANRLREYCISRVLALGLATLSIRSQDLYLGNNAVATRKTIGKLRTLLNKHLEKTMPYIKATRVPFLEVSDRERLKVTFEAPTSHDNLREVDWAAYAEEFLPADEPGRLEPRSDYIIQHASSVKRWLARNSRQHKWAKRYSNYLNYLCRKNHVPISVKAETVLTYDYTDLGEQSMLSSEAEKIAFKMKSTFTTTLVFSMNGWIAYGNLDGRAQGYWNGENEDDSVFSNQAVNQNGGWELSAIVGISDGEFAQLSSQSPTMIFHHLDKVVKVLQTLSRKACYGHSAYTFRSI